MLDALRRRRRSSAQTIDSSLLETTSRPVTISPPARGNPKPYEIPPKDGCPLLELPDEVLTRVFTSLDRVSLTRCFRLCKRLNELLTLNSAISLHHTLLCNSLTLNPNVYTLSSNLNQIPPSSSRLLSNLRERLTRFRNLQPKSTAPLEFRETEGNLYEYLEGVLLRGIGRRTGGSSTAREIAFYDIRQLDDWEDEPGQRGDNEVEDEEGEVDAEETTESEADKDIRRVKSFGFDVAEFAVDPGLDLLVLVEVKPTNRTRFAMNIHLLSLSTFEPHPLARKPVLEWPGPLTRPRISLGFQICDDGLFILKHNSRGGPQDQVCGWQWTTGRLAVTLSAFPTMSFESFVLLSPSSFVIPTIVTHLDPNSETLDQLDNPADLSWTHHLHLYAFPPLSSAKFPEDRSEPDPPPHTATHIATLDLPQFHVDIFNNIPPPRLTIRTDPPPRHTFPMHPVGSVSQFCPDPITGIIVIEIHCQTPDILEPHYVMIIHKSTLAQYLPAPTSPLLLQAFPRPAPVVPWATLAPHTRVLGPNIPSSSWVCYVYHNRYITFAPRNDASSERSRFRLYDFDPLRVKKEVHDRAEAEVFNDGVTVDTQKQWFSSKVKTGIGRLLDGDRDGIVLASLETVLPRDTVLPAGLVTGSKLPYMYVERPTWADTALIDGERIIGVRHHTDRWHEVISTDLEVMEF